MTGIASGEILKYNLNEFAEYAKVINARVAVSIGINIAARITCVKPAGTTSCVLGCSSGIHAWHDKYYLRTIRLNRNEDVALYFIVNHPELVEDDVLRKDTVCVRIPIKAPDNAIMRTESAVDLLERVKKLSTEWVFPGHRSGDNTHNVSATISVKDNEWEEVGDWMWDNKDYYNGLSILPHSDHSYTQAPFETITEEEYNTRVSQLTSVDLTKVVELDDITDLKAEVACGAGGCELK